MPGRKRRNRQPGGSRTSTRDSAKAIERGKELLDEEAIGSGLFDGVPAPKLKEVGLACPECGYGTTKRGSAAVQAMRAHSKRHVRDRRGRTRQARWLLYFLAAALVVALLPKRISSPLVVELELSLNAGDRHIDVVGPALMLCSVLAAIAVLTAWSNYLATGRRRWSSRYTFAVYLALVPMLVAVVSRWTEPGGAVSWLWLLATLLPWTIALLTGPGVARTRLTVRRREFVPAIRLRLFRSIDKFTDAKIRSAIRDLRAAIVDGRFQTYGLTGPQQRVLKRLGLGDARPDWDRVDARLEEEERRLEGEEMERARALERRKRARAGHRREL